MQQPNKGIISPGLKGLMLVQEGLRQLKQGQVSSQGPAGPTLAMQMAQAATPQVAQGGAPMEPSMAPPPLGQEPEGEIANIAQNAGLGAAIQGQQQQQAQQAAMRMAMAQQAQQQQPAMMASGGIAGLRADNMNNFKEGGVLGFAGKNEEVGSKVPGPDEMAQGGYDAESMGVTKKDLKRMAAQFGTPLAMLSDIGQLPISAALKYLLPPSEFTGDKVEMMPSTNALHKIIMANQPDRAAPAGIEAAYQDPNRARLDVPTDTTAAAYQDQSRAKDVPQRVGIATPRPSPMGGRPSEAPPAPSSAPPSVTAQINEALNAIKAQTPPNPYLDKQAANQEELIKLRAAQPAPNQVALQALLDAQQKRAKLSAEDEAGAGGRGLAALFQGMMGRNEGASVAAHNEREKQRRRLDIAETLADKEKESAILDIQAAKAVGDKEKEAAGYEKLSNATMEGQKIQAQLASSALGLSSSNITAAAHIEAQRLSNASHEKIAAMQRAQAAMQHSLPSYEQQLVERLVKDQVAKGIPELTAREVIYKAMGKGNYAAGESAAEKAIANRLKAVTVWNDTNLGRLQTKDPEKLKQALAERDAFVNQQTGTSATAYTPEQTALLSKYGLQ
jgi:hypothetical protein